MTEFLRKLHESRARNKGHKMTASEIISQLSKLPPDASVYVMRNHGTDDEWLEPIETIQLVPRPAIISDEETQL